MQRRSDSSPDRSSERGRQADRPSEIPARGWLDILKRTFERFGKDRLLLISAGVTFYLLLALIPALAAFLSLYGLFFAPEDVTRHINRLAAIMPQGTLELVGREATRIVSQGGGTLSAALITGFLISLWSANAGMKAIIEGLNVAYGETEKRSFLWLNLRSLAMTVGAMVALLVTIAGLAIVPLVLAALAPAPAVSALISIGRWPLLLGLVVLAIAALYRFGPSRDKPRWRWLTWGSGAAAIAWLAASLLFSWYVSNFGQYNATYGSLGAVIALMTWMWLSTTVILLGAELNAEIEHQTARDTTTGPNAPMGSRGATMADTVGEARP
ncbi:MAG TPA: YihY/virulence factor BrkB family protein [Hyphomicrobiaceae bacterium]|nr:YihY/virulence factor BrkB family protein [Hyphomicrobiaceae bacterium]